MLVGVPQRSRTDRRQMYLYREQEIDYKEFARTVRKTSPKFCGLTLQQAFYWVMCQGR